MVSSGTWKKSFFTLYSGQAFSLLSSNAVQFAIIWWITIETGSAIALTAASLVGLLPQILIGPFAGVWIDHYNRKSIMIAADIVVAASSLILAISFFFGTPSLWLVYAVLFARALGETFHKPALQAAIPQLVPKDQLTRAGGLGQTISSLIAMAGPLLGALLMSITSLQYLMLLDIIGAVLAVFTLTLVKITMHTTRKSKRPKITADIKLGIQAIRENAVLMRIIIPVFLTSIVFLPLGSLLPLMVREFFQGTAWHNGIVQALFSLGMVTSALLIGITGGLKKPLYMISLSSLLLGICSLIGGSLPAGAFWLFCILVFLMGTTGMLGSIPFMAYIQSSVPQEDAGKVISLVTSMMSVGIPAGMIIAGPAAELIGVNQWMVVVGFLMLGVGTFSLFLFKPVMVTDPMGVLK
jgi:MFS transporter, DHA3 family, macrolide efflux protein